MSVEIGGNKAIHVRVDGDATDDRVEELNAALDRIVPWSDLRNAEALRFAIWDGEIAGNAKVMGDDWDLAIYLRSLAALSDALGRRTLRIDLEPDGGELVLKSGRFTRHRKVVDAFLASMSSPRPSVEGIFERLRLDLQLSSEDAARFEEKLRAELQRFTRFDRLEITASRSGGSSSWQLPLGGRARTASFLVHAFANLWLQAQLPDETVGALELSGAKTRRWTIEGWMSLLEIHHELRVAVGPAEADPPPPTPEPEPRMEPQVIGRYPDLAATLAGGALEWSSATDDRFRLDSDGTLRVVADQPALVDGELRRGRGYAGQHLLTTALTVEALGHLKFRFQLVAPDGAVLDGPTFVNVSRSILVEEDGAWFTARIDGRTHLVHLEIPSLRASTLKLWKGELSDEHVVRTPDGRLLIVRGSHPAGRAARVEIHEVANGSIRQLGKRIEADLSSVVEATDSAAWVLCGRWSNPRYPDEHVDELARIDIESGRVAFLSEEVERPAASRLEQAVRLGDAWLILLRWHGVARLAGGDAELLYRCTGEREELALAVSATGTVALVSSIGDRGRLHLIRVDGQPISLELPRPGATGLTWTR